MVTSVLHTVNKSPFTSTLLEQCIRRMSVGDCIVLMEDGVYAALPSQPFTEQLKHLAERSSCYVIENDCIARGLDSSQFLDGINLISIEGFVELTVKHTASHSWY